MAPQFFINNELLKVIIFSRLIELRVKNTYTQLHDNTCTLTHKLNNIRKKFREKLGSKTKHHQMSMRALWTWSTGCI